MTEIEKIKYTKSFVDRMAEGINPLTGEEIPPNDLLNNIRISRCLFYVSSILGKIISNGGIERHTSGALPFEITREQLNKIKPSDDLGITDFVRLINEQVDLDRYRKLKVTAVTEWLVDEGYLYVETRHDKKRKRPTEKGFTVGITAVTRTGKYGEYEMVLYSKEAQEFILANIDAIAAKNNAARSATPDL